MRKVTKTEVHEFIGKCKKKALAALDKQHKEDRAALISKFIEDNSDFACAVNALGKATTIYNKQIDTINNEITNEDKWAQPKWSSEKSLNHIVSDGLVEKIFQYHTPTTGGFKVLEEIFDKQRNQTVHDYEALKQHTTEHTARAAVNYLEELGFDLSWFAQPVNVVDPKNLFVCGKDEKGVR